MLPAQYLFSPASTTAIGCGKFFFTFLLSGLLYDMWGTRLRGWDAVTTKTCHRRHKTIASFGLGIKARVKTYPPNHSPPPVPQPAAASSRSPIPSPRSPIPSFPISCLLPTPLIPQSAEKVGGGSTTSRLEGGGAPCRTKTGGDTGRPDVATVATALRAWRMRISRSTGLGFVQVPSSLSLSLSLSHITLVSPLRRLQG
jgi:hypothetical protein